VNGDQAALIAEQLAHQLDLVRSDLKLAQQRLDSLEARAADYETRLRTLTDGVTQFRVLAGMATGGGLVSLVALLRELLR
jgi:cell division protein FtsB